MRVQLQEKDSDDEGLVEYETAMVVDADTVPHDHVLRALKHTLGVHDCEQLSTNAIPSEDRLAHFHSRSMSTSPQLLPRSVFPRDVGRRRWFSLRDSSWRRPILPAAPGTVTEERCAATTVAHGEGTVVERAV